MAVPGGISVGPSGPAESALLPATKGPRSASDDGCPEFISIPSRAPRGIGKTAPWLPDESFDIPNYFTLTRTDMPELDNPPSRHRISWQNQSVTSGDRSGSNTWLKALAGKIYYCCSLDEPRIPMSGVKRVRHEPSAGSDSGQ
jgi:hypothetical protein